MKFSHLLVPVAFLFVFVSCESVKESSKVGAKFYGSIKAKNFDDIIKHLDESALASHTAEDWKGLLKHVQSYSGDLTGFKREGISTNYSNGVSTTTLNFTVKYSQGTRAEVLKFIERDGDYRITGYDTKPNNDHKEIKTEGDALQDLVAGKLDAFYSQVGSRDFDGLVNELDREALLSSTKDDWLGVLNARDELAGDFQKYEVLNFDETMNGSFQQVEVVVKANYQNGHLFERLILLNRTDGLKVRGYQYNASLEKLTNPT